MPPPASLADYQDAYRHVKLTRRDGVLTVALHTDGSDMRWGGGPHQELGWCFGDIAADRENKVVILTGTGENFIAGFEAASVDRRSSKEWDHVYADGNRLLRNLLDIPVPMVAAINGPATVHSELALLCDVVLAADTVVFQDAPHFGLGVTPGDGSHIVWPLLLGPNRGRYFLLTDEQLSVHRAMDLGVVAEVLSADSLMARAHEIAEMILERSELTRRYTREALTLPLKRALFGDLPYGLALEGLAAGAAWPTGIEVGPPSQAANARYGA